MMKRFPNKKCILIFALLFTLHSAFSQTAVLEGFIYDKTNEDPLISATVKVGESGTVTDANGRYEIKIEAGTYEIEVGYIGYASQKQRVSLQAGQRLQVDFNLKVTTTLLETATVTTGKYEKPISEVTVSLEVLQPSLIDNTNATSIDDALEKIPGLNIVDGQANIRGGSGWSYGAGSRVLLLIDDIPALQADAGFPNWNDIPIENTERAEVVKGAASALYGSSAMNGIINVRTAYAKAKPVTKISTFYRSFRDPKDEAKVWWEGQDRPFETGLSLAHRQKFNKFDLVLGGYTLYSNSFREDTYNRYGRISIGTRYRLTDRLSFGINSNINKGKNSSYFYWRDGEAGAYQGDTTSISISDNVRFNVDPFLTYFDGSGGKHRLITRLLRVDNDNNADQSNTSNFYYGEYQYQKEFEKAQLVATAGAVTSATSVSAPLYGDTTFHSNNFATYLQLEKKLGQRINLSGGVRFERNEQRSPEVFAGDTIPNGKVVESKPVFRFGMNYKMTNVTFLRASWGQGYRYPTIAEKFIETAAGAIIVAPNLDLTSETGWSAEVGLKQGFNLGSFQGYMDVAGFWTEYQDMIEFNIRFTLPISFQAQNIGNTIIRGIDFTIAGQGDILGLSTSLLAGYTYINPKFQEFTPEDELFSSADYNVLKYRNRHSVKFDIESRKGPVSLGIAAFYNSRVEAIDAILNLELPGLADYRENFDGGAFTLDTRLAFYFLEGGKVSLIAANLFNVEYMRRPALLEAPRNLTLRLDYQF
ncbi:MAG: TonB-dependent receptor [Bacteroidota bacterium]